ncbi:Cell division protein FtsQ [Serratia symbiotica]|nr:Cell division protein FtsQ [Serratia symbiotica]
MPQAALNVRCRRIGNDSHPSNDVQFGGVILLLMLLETILWSGWAVISWMKAASHQPISRLIVTGEHDYTSIDDIRQASQSLGEPMTFMRQNVAVIKQQIERLPWIKQVSVSKQWPDQLKIHLVEHIPVARWNDWSRVDAEGIPFREPIEWVGKQTLPLLYGPEGSEKEVLESYLAMSTILAASKYTLKMLTMSARHSWQLTLDNNVRLELGRDDRTGRLKRFIELYPILQQQGLDKNKRVSYVDLRYESGASVGWVPLRTN